MKNVAFNFIRYANVWEDAAVLEAGLHVSSGDRVLSIGSAGDNCLALLSGDPELVVAADLNAAQLHLIALKVAVIRRLPYWEALDFLGFELEERGMDTEARRDREDVGFELEEEGWDTEVRRNRGNVGFELEEGRVNTEVRRNRGNVGVEMRKRTSRLDVYQNLRSELSADARAFWDGHQQDISAGVIHAGKFERYFRLFARYVRPLIHSDAATARLLASKSATEQADFYHQKWNTRRWRFLFRLFFSRWMMGNVGRDPAFLAQVQCDVSDYIFRKAEAHLTQEAATRNFILRYNLTGSFGDLLPDYLASEARFGMIRDRLNRLVLRPGYVQEAGREFGSFDAMNLSDIFEYMPVPVFQEVGRQLRQIAKPGCRIGYWNLMAPRRLSLDLPELFHYEAALSQTLTQSDRGFFYNQFILDTAL